MKPFKENKKVPLALGVFTHIDAKSAVPGSRVQGFFKSVRIYTLSASCFFLLYSSSLLASPIINLDIISQIESSGKSRAVGDSGQALGLYQLHKEAVLDVNSLLKTSYLHRDVLDPKVARIVANAYFERVIPTYLKHYWLKDTLENRLTAWNMGIKAVQKGKLATSYISKYKKLEASQ